MKRKLKASSDSASPLALHRSAPWVILACAGAIFFDGYDTMAVAYVAPSLAKSFGVAPASLGPAFSAGLVGITLGAMCIAPLADRFGRRPITLGSILLFACFTLATVAATDLKSLILLRVLTGLGLGGCMPNAIALTAEYAPDRRRGFLISLMFSGFTVGSIVGGLLAHRLIPAFGWRIVFLAGGCLPLLGLPVMFMAIPESADFIASGAGREQHPAHPEPCPRRWTLPGFMVGRLWATLALWVVFFMSLLDLYLLVSWLPIALNQAGISSQTAILLDALLQAGGIIGILALGNAVDQYDARVILVSAYLLAAACIAAIGLLAPTGIALLSLVISGAGFGIIGGQTAANGVAATLYPTAVRSTGVGWALGVGRLGSILGPLLAGWWIFAHVPIAYIFLLSSVPALIAAAAATLYRPHR